VCLREGAEVGEEPRRGDGSSGASAGALERNRFRLNRDFALSIGSVA
jgi:hypothetical protein